MGYDARQHIIEDLNGGIVRDCGVGPMAMKRNVFLLFVGVLSMMLAMVPGVAFANAGVHGNYIDESEQCATCHRAHNAPSPITWTDNRGQVRSALLINASARTTGEFCYTCHGTSSQGADTNVEDGVYEARSSSGAYGEPGQPLNSGPWGGWTTPLMTASNVRAAKLKAARITMDCSVCHDVHGTSNFRLLKAKVLGNDVGGYDSNDDPTPFVIAAEKGFPVGGFRLHEDSVAAGYQPDYTTPKHAKAPDEDPAKGISGWCGSCHTFPAGSSHFHPVNVPLSNWTGLPALRISDNPLPLAHDPSEGAGGADVINTASDWIDCTTCHIAHTPHGNTSSPTRYPGVCETCHNF
jgi:hypothetical protein